MKIKLIRNLNSQRDKEQEDSFSETMNLALYFDINKTINKVDGWKLANIKKLVKNIHESNTDIDIEFTKWDDNVEYIFDNLEVDLIQFHQLDEKILNSLKQHDYLTIHNYINEIKDDKNLKLEFLLSIAEELKGNVDASIIINEFINKGISTIDVAIDTILPLLLLEES